MFHGTHFRARWHLVPDDLTLMTGQSWHHDATFFERTASLLAARQWLNRHAIFLALAALSRHLSANFDSSGDLVSHGGCRS
jgi:hypothetical protein